MAMAQRVVLWRRQRWWPTGLDFDSRMKTETWLKTNQKICNTPLKILVSGAWFPLWPPSSAGPDRKHDAKVRSYSMISPTYRRLFTAFNSCNQNRQIIELKIKYAQILRYAHIASINTERCLRTIKEKGIDSSRCWSRIAWFMRENRWARDPSPEKKKNAV